jgi:tRNA dimethylallyltransferase
VICITGPTAVGKSEVADGIAARLGTSVVSVDSMQVYRGMDIGTAKMPERDRTVPLLMTDVCDVTEDYSVSRFQSEARRCADSLLARGEIPVLCGGTGLYLDAVIEDMSFTSGRLGSETRRKYERIAETEGPGVLHSLLAKRDPSSAVLIHPNNVRRVIRALEMLDEGRSYSEQHVSGDSRRPYYEASIWCLTMSRDRLCERIDARVDAMIDAGLIDEVRQLCAVGLLGSTTAGNAIGYKELIPYLAGDVGLAEAVTSIKTNSRRYAKRQMTWVRRNPDVKEIDMDTFDTASAIERVLEFESDRVGEKGASHV